MESGAKHTLLLLLASGLGGTLGGLLLWHVCGFVTVVLMKVSNMKKGGWNATINWQINLSEKMVVVEDW